MRATLEADSLDGHLQRAACMRGFAASFAPAIDVSATGRECTAGGGDAVVTDCDVSAGTGGRKADSLFPFGIAL